MSKLDSLMVMPVLSILCVLEDYAAVRTDELMNTAVADLGSEMIGLLMLMALSLALAAGGVPRRGAFEILLGHFFWRNLNIEYEESGKILILKTVKLGTLKLALLTL